MKKLTAKYWGDFDSGEELSLDEMLKIIKKDSHVGYGAKTSHTVLTTRYRSI